MATLKRIDLIRRLKGTPLPRAICLAIAQDGDEFANDFCDGVPCASCAFDINSTAGHKELHAQLKEYDVWIVDDGNEE